MRRRGISSGAAALAGATLLAVLIAGCGLARRSAETSPAPVIRISPTSGRHDAKAAGRVAVSKCPAGLHGCRNAAGRIVYVEGVDPDGDGDAHFVVLDAQGITLPGLTAIDVRAGLRPRPLPGVGGLLSAAGPLQTGSYGESEIHALEVHVAH
ncbi:MAG: hypothetical protein ACRDLL_09760 [Solirubrobacterales bacterium]